MAKCPKCGKKLPKSASKCPNCQKTVLKNKLPKDVKLKEVPLKVKKVSTAKKKPSSNLSFNTISIFLIIALILVNLVLLSNFLSTPKVQDQLDHDNEKQFEPSKLGMWTSQNNELFVFSQDENFYWYNTYNELNDNYYHGTYNYTNGLDALTEMGYTEEEFYTTFGNDIALENVYSINIFPSLIIENEKDLTSTKIKENESWWYLLIIKNDDSAIAYNKTLDLRYDLTKYNNR